MDKKYAQQSLTSDLFSKTCLINAIMQEHSCEIVLIFYTAFVHDYESRISQLETYRTSDRSIIEEQMERIVNLETNNTVIFNAIMQVEALTNRHNNGLRGNDEQLIKVEEGMEIQDISIAELEKIITDIDTIIKENATENIDMRSQITDLEIKGTSIETAIKEAEAEFNGLETSINETETRIKQTEENITQLKTDVTEMESRISNLEIRINVVESGINETGADMTTLQTNIIEMDTKINEIEIKCDILNLTLEEHSSLIANLESYTSSNQGEILNHTLRIIELETLLDAQNSSEILQLESELTIHRADIDANLNRIKQLKENFTAEKVMYQNKSLFLQGLESEIASVQAMVSNQTDAINRVMVDAREQVRNQSEAINQLRIDVLEQNTSVHTCISGLQELKSKQTLDEAALVNLNLMIAEVRLSLLLHNSTIQTQNDILQDLVVYMNDSQGILLDHSRELTDIKGKTNIFYIN